MNPPGWRDGESRVAVARMPASGLSAALRASFRPAPLPDDLVKLLARLR